MSTAVRTAHLFVGHHFGDKTVVDLTDKLSVPNGNCV